MFNPKTGWSNEAKSVPITYRELELLCLVGQGNDYKEAAEILGLTYSTVKTYMHNLGQAARKASRALVKANSSSKNAALLAMADSIAKNSAAILAANQTDMEAGRQGGLDAALRHRS